MNTSHGTVRSYRTGCRCHDCREAFNAPRRNAYIPTLIPVDDVRDHLNALHADGISMYRIAQRSGYSANALWWIRHKAQSIRPETAQDLLSITKENIA